MKSTIQNIRSKVEKREVVQYLLLRERILHDTIKREKTSSSIKLAKARRSEIMALIVHIKKDTIRPKIKVMHQHIHRQNDYVKLEVSE